MRTKTVEYGEGGWRAVVFSDDDIDNPRIGYWFGEQNECERVDPKKVKLYPMNSDRPDPFDLACERRSDG